MADPFVTDDWDWPYILYVGRKWLGYTDDETWSMTPRKFLSQLNVHRDIENAKHGNKEEPDTAGFIDQIPGW